MMVEHKKPDPLEHTLLHQLLVNSNNLQRLPGVVVLGCLVFNAVIVGAAWSWNTNRQQEALLVAASSLLFSLIDWGLLIGLRRAGRSFGPDKPSALALSVLRTLILVVVAALRLPWWFGILAVAVITPLVYYATWIEPFRLGVTQQRYTSKDFRPGKPLRLLQIGDIHIERITPRERELNRLVKELAPDVIIFTGDFVNLSCTYDPLSETDIRTIISEWRAPLGVYCVSGTPLVEPLDRVKAFVGGLDNLTFLEDQWKTVETPNGTLHILGMVVTHDMAVDRAKLQRMMAQAPSAPGMKLLDFHPPDIAPEANDAGIDLYLCGHTHGGQIRLPVIGAVFSASQLGHRFVMGRYELGITTLYTARGVGLEGLGAPRARFLCPPEIVLWEISGEAS
jgi:uncharacterized protein